MLMRILVLQASGNFVRKDYGHRVIDVTEIDEILDAQHVQARDKDGEPVPDVEGERQYEPKAVHLVRYLHGSNVSPIYYTVRGTINQWRDTINKKRFQLVKSLDQEEPEPATDS